MKIHIKAKYSPDISCSYLGLLLKALAPSSTYALNSHCLFLFSIRQILFIFGLPVRYSIHWVRQLPYATSANVYSPYP